MINLHQSLADLALTYSGASRIFRQNGLDFCCRGTRSVAEACEERNIDAQSIIHQIEASQLTASSLDWTTRPIGQLVDHILLNFHEAHRRELPDLIELARKVERVHAAKAEVPAGLAEHLGRMQSELLDHMHKEERVLFPAILSGQGYLLYGPIAQMEREHEDHGARLATLRELAGDFVSPADACTSWRALLLRCEQLEVDLMAHVHLENHVLFPRALRGA
jgi:regulator of cell morphogenesis and NO signaling